MTGELEDDHMKPSLPLIATTDNNDTTTIDLTSVDKASQLPTILSKSPSLVDNTLSIQAFDKMNQIVLECRICSSDHLAPDGTCLYDPSQLVITDESQYLDSTDTSTPTSDKSQTVTSTTDPEHTTPTTTTTTPTTEASTTESDTTPECPVCKYIKNGACKDEFLSWDNCISNAGESEEAIRACFPHTVTMMACFKEHEYYDIMTAGTRPHIYNNATTIE